MDVRGMKAALGLGTAILTFAGVVATGANWLSKRFTEVDNRMQKLENAIRALNVNTSDDKYRELIRELMASVPATTGVRTRPAKIAPALGSKARRSTGYNADSGVSASSPAAVPPPKP